MGEEELTPNFEQGELGEGFTAEHIVEILYDLRKEGDIDFEDEDAEHVRQMPPDEALEFLIITVESAGGDSEAVLKRAGLVQMIRPNSPQVREIQHGGDSTFVSEDVDKIARAEEGHPE